jgi:hypothetical protein
MISFFNIKCRKSNKNLIWVHFNKFLVIMNVTIPKSKQFDFLPMIEIYDVFGSKTDDHCYNRLSPKINLKHYYLNTSHFNNFFMIKQRNWISMSRIKNNFFLTVCIFRYYIQFLTVTHVWLEIILRPSKNKN